MRLFIGLLLITSFAQASEDFESRLKALEKKHGDEEFQLRPRTRFDGKYPNDEYAKEYGVLKERQLKEVLALHEEECKKTKTHCLSESEIKLRSVQSRIAIGLVSKKNQWAKEGLTQTEIAKKEEEYKQESSETLCKEAGKCDEKPSRDISSDSSSESPQVDTPQVETPQVETPQVDTPQVDTPQVDTPQTETSDPKPETEAPKVETPKTETSTQVDIAGENEDEKSPRNYDANTCKWVNDLPRKIVNGPGCSSTGRSRICTGYVICDQKVGGGRFIRMSTCRAEYCGNTDAHAVKCTKDQRYFSEKPWGEEKLFMSPKLKKILSGASEQ